jgi:hypothetical protein
MKRAWQVVAFAAPPLPPSTGDFRIVSLHPCTTEKSLSGFVLF